MTGKATRGTSNRNERGSAESRRRRRAWLIETYRADVDLVEIWNVGGGSNPRLDPATEVIEAKAGMYPQILTHHDDAEISTLAHVACRCYRCGTLLTVTTLTSDRIIMGCDGGTYRRNNIRPACAGCNSETGGGHARRPKKRKRATQ